MEIVLPVPEGLTAMYEANMLRVSGPKGSVERVFSHPRVFLESGGKDVRIRTESDARKDRAVVGTWAAHIKNMFMGVQEGYEYKLKIVSTHFPITVKVVEGEVHISNFMGEKGIRRAKILDGCKVSIQKEYITVAGLDKERVAQTAANIESACMKKRKDPRVFQDGIYIIKKG